MIVFYLDLDEMLKFVTKFCRP